MINAIINGVLSFVNGLLGLILAPVDTLISQFLPDFSQVLTDFGYFIDEILGIIPWVLSWFNIPMALLTLALVWAISKIGLLLGTHMLKVTLAWWRTLKL